MKCRVLLLVFWLVVHANLDSGSGLAQTHQLKPAPSPVDNPLKGLVPYARPFPDRFPHSMEFSYLPLSQLVVGEKQYDWQPLEDLLNDIASRGNQAVVRIFMEYPGKKEGIPQYLIDRGLKVHRYMNTNTAPFPPTEVATPDYENKDLRAALKDFIAAWGAKYDGDPRLAYITAGLLGTWGEWHTYPRNELWASFDVQSEVLDAYEQAFQQTPVLLRYPAKAGHYAQAANADRPFGYHDDSFAWATIDTGREEDDWFYMPALKAAGKGAVNKWKQHPIGGEIRPEVWGKIFDAPKSWPKEAQDFAQCVAETHVTWLMDTGMFREEASRQRYNQAVKEVRKMGYDFHIQRATFEKTGSKERPQLRIEIGIVNQGVAPFYANWESEIAFADSAKAIEVQQVVPSFQLREIFPGSKAVSRSATVDVSGLADGKYQVLLRVVNPLSNGKMLRFANEEQDQDVEGWITLGTYE